MAGPLGFGGAGQKPSAWRGNVPASRRPESRNRYIRPYQRIFSAPRERATRSIFRVRQHGLLTVLFTHNGFLHRGPGAGCSRDVVQKMTRATAAPNKALGWFAEKHEDEQGQGHAHGGHGHVAAAVAQCSATCTKSARTHLWPAMGRKRPMLVPTPFPTSLNPRNVRE